MAGQSTDVIVSHRLSSCRLADRILVFHNSRLIEKGTHTELMEQGGHYASLYRLKARWYSENLDTNRVEDMSV